MTQGFWVCATSSWEDFDDKAQTKDSHRSQQIPTFWIYLFIDCIFRGLQKRIGISWACERHLRVELNNSWDDTGYIAQQRGMELRLSYVLFHTYRLKRQYSEGKKLTRLQHWGTALGCSQILVCHPPLLSVVVDSVHTGESRDITYVNAHMINNSLSYVRSV